VIKTGNFRNDLLVQSWEGVVHAKGGGRGWVAGRSSCAL